MKVWHSAVLGVAAVGAGYMGWKWYQKRQAQALGMSVGDSDGLDSGSAPIDSGSFISSALPAPVRVSPESGNAGKSPTMRSGVTMMGRPDIAARREAGAQAAANLRGTANSAAAAGMRAIVAAGGLAESLGDSTKTTAAAKDKAKEMAKNTAYDAKKAAGQATDFVKAMDGLGSRVIRGL